MGTVIRLGEKYKMSIDIRKALGITSASMEYRIKSRPETMSLRLGTIYFVTKDLLRSDRRGHDLRHIWDSVPSVDGYLPVGFAAEVLGLSHHQFHYRVTRYEIPVTRHGRALMVDMTEFYQYWDIGKTIVAVSGDDPDKDEMDSIVEIHNQLYYVY